MCSQMARSRCSSHETKAAHLEITFIRSSTRACEPTVFGAFCFAQQRARSRTHRFVLSDDIKVNRFLDHEHARRIVDQGRRRACALPERSALFERARCEDSHHAHAPRPP